MSSYNFALKFTDLLYIVAEQILFAMFENVNIKQLGKILRFIRESKNFSLEAVALQSGYSDKTTLSRIETGTIHISFEKLQEICHALECNVSLVMAFAEINIELNFSIQSWNVFFSSVAKMEHHQQSKMLDFIRDIFPNKYIEVKEKISI